MRMSHGAGYVCSGSTSSTESEAARPTFYGSWKLQHGIATNQAASLHLERTDLAYGQAWWAKPGYSPKAVIAGCCLLDCRWRMEFRKLGRGRLAKHRITCRALCRNSCSCCMCFATYIYISNKASRHSSCEQATCTKTSSRRSSGKAAEGPEGLVLQLICHGLPEDHRTCPKNVL